MQPARLKSFVEASTGKQNLNTLIDSFWYLKRPRLRCLQNFMVVGCQLIDASHWQIRAHSEQAVRDFKKELGLNSSIRVGVRENFMAMRLG